MRFTLRQLQVFLAVAHYENVTQAASSLALSQSAASTALKELEQRYSTQLFDRAGKRLQLNEQGQIMRPKAEALLAQAEEFDRDLDRHASIGHLRVGATLTIGNYLAVAILTRFMHQHPGSRVELVVENTRAIAGRVRNFDLDLGLIEGELHDPALEVLPWRDDELALFCAPEHPLAEKTVLSDEDLLGAEWIVRETGSGTRQAFDRGMKGLLGDLNLILELQHTEGIKRAVEANLGIGCLSRLTLEDAFQRGRLVPLQAPHRDWQRKFYFILHRDKYRTSGILSWLDLCRNFDSQ